MARDLARGMEVDVTRLRVAIGPGLAHGPNRQAGDALCLAVRLGEGQWLRARQRLFDPTRRWAHRR